MPEAFQHHDLSHKLRAILSPLHDDSRYNLRKQLHFNMPQLRTDRTKSTSIFAMSRKFNWKLSKLYLGCGFWFLVLI